jgi:SAM-dependent methyltransferase
MMTQDTYNAKNEWTRLYQDTNDLSYPAEGVIRILKGTFPELLMPKPTSGKILDLGCGDGRHFPLFDQVGLLGYGTEITADICAALSQRLKDRFVKFGEISNGTTENLPYPDTFFDYLLTWNSCYYMSAGGGLDFSKHISEMARVLKQDAWIICSIPKKTCFIYKDSRPAAEKGFRILAKDPWGTREGEVLKCYESRTEIVTEFGEHFSDFCHADIDMEWFGLCYHWHVFVARKK